MQTYYDLKSDQKQNKLSQSEAYQRAARRVHTRMVFRLHMVSFLMGSLLLVGIYLLTRTLPGFPHNLWIIWPLLGWSSALILHFLLAFVFDTSEAEDRFEQMIRNELNRPR